MTEVIHRFKNHEKFIDGLYEDLFCLPFSIGLIGHSKFRRKSTFSCAVYESFEFSGMTSLYEKLGTDIRFII